MDMLAFVLEGDSQRLEALLLEYHRYINLPIGLPFDVPGRFYNHPAMYDTIILQHPNQTLLDIACAMPPGPVVWVLLSYNGKGSKHPFGTDLALHNAIKNGRTYTVQSLLMAVKERVNGEPGTSWKPFLQAVFWNHPHIVRCLIDKGADINITSPCVDGVEMNGLQHCLDRRCRDYESHLNRDNCEKILKMLLDAGADIRPAASEHSRPPTFDMFIKPWQNEPDWVSRLNPVEIECLGAFVRRGADLQTKFRGRPCSALSGNTFQHEILWHGTPEIARLVIDNADPTPTGNGNGLLHEIVGSCPEAKRHPSDTLRDIEVLLRRGTDPNQCDSSGYTPLRRCIDLCPAVDIIPRLRLLLDYGADPELKHGNRLPPYVLAARNFEEPIRSQILEVLVAKISGRQQHTIYNDTFTWAADYFPIPSTPTWTQVQCYSGQNGAFNANLVDMVPEDIRAAFQRAVFSVASLNFLNAATAQAKSNLPLSMSTREKDDIFQAVLQRQLANLPEYQFSQDFVMGLLKPQMAPLLPNFDGAGGASRLRAQRDNDFMLPHQTPILSLAPPDPSAVTAPPRVDATAPVTATTDVVPSPPRSPSPSNAQRRASTSSTVSDCAFIPETTQIRWPQIGDRTRHADLKRAKDAVLITTCSECGTGRLLTKNELARHEIEHAHTRECLEEGCRRRFCVVARMGFVGLEDRGDEGEGENAGRVVQEDGEENGVGTGAGREFRFSAG